jgi:hypothetical protein
MLDTCLWQVGTEEKTQRRSLDVYAPLDGNSGTIRL